MLSLKSYHKQIRDDAMLIITDQEFDALSRFVKQNYGIHLKEEKKSLVSGRLSNMVSQLGFQNFSDYYNYVVADKTGEAVLAFVEKITTNHTFFMREASHFDYLQQVVLPYLKETITDKDLRIWSAGCSGGDEPYTLAMLLDSFFGKEKFFWDTKILATDISEKVLKTAREAIYENERLKTLPKEWKQNYTKKFDEENYILIDRIKNEVIYRRFNLMEKSFPFKKKFHVIFCRNVMIYFDNKTKQELVEKFYNMTEPGGYLFIGHSESLQRDETKYQYVMPSIYRKL